MFSACEENCRPTVDKQEAPRMTPHPAIRIWDVIPCLLKEQGIQVFLSRTF